jgi:hypothetical protein
MTDVQFMVLVTVACSVVAGVVGLVAIRVARRLSLMLALLVAALVPVAAVVAALAVNVSAMFISPHDAFVVRLVLGTASVLEVLLALALGRMVAGEVRLVVDGARRLGQVPAPGPGDRRAGGGDGRAGGDTRTAGGVPGGGAGGAARAPADHRVREPRPGLPVVGHPRGRRRAA